MVNVIGLDGIKLKYQGSTSRGGKLNGTRIYTSPELHFVETRGSGIYHVFTREDHKDLFMVSAEGFVSNYSPAADGPLYFVCLNPDTETIISDSFGNVTVNVEGSDNIVAHTIKNTTIYTGSSSRNIDKPPKRKNFLFEPPIINGIRTNRFKKIRGVDGIERIAYATYDDSRYYDPSTHVLHFNRAELNMDTGILKYAGYQEYALIITLDNEPEPEIWLG